MEILCSVSLLSGFFTFNGLSGGFQGVGLAQQWLLFCSLLCLGTYLEEQKWNWKLNFLYLRDGCQVWKRGGQREPQTAKRMGVLPFCTI